MKIINESNGEYNFPEELRPLFEAMEAGQKIKSVTCMNGFDNESDHSKDFIIEGFTPSQYIVAFAGTKEEPFDYVRVSSTTVERDFYMSWVRSFELY